VLGLLLLWAGGGVEPGVPADWAAGWYAEREQRAERAAARADAPPADRAAGAVGPADPAAAEKRAAQRAARVAAGLDELDRWLADQVRTGLAGLERAGYRQFDTLAARMVDAQAPAVAAGVRRLAGIAAGGSGWPGRLLAEFALLHLTVEAHRRLPALPAPLAATVRTRVGYPVGQDDVLATPPVPDSWAVLGLRDHAEDRLTARRVWLRGERTGRLALVLSFAPTGGALDATLLPGTVVDADLHYYPGAAPLRAVVGARHGEPRPLSTLAGGMSIGAALAAYAAALAADPWLTSWPVLLAGVVPVPGEPWRLAEPAGAALSIVEGSAEVWRLLAVSGGRPVPVAAEYTMDGLRPLSVLDGSRLVPV
jgi:hypothetical protein